jgi:hypothetical protein
MRTAANQHDGIKAALEANGSVTLALAASESRSRVDLHAKYEAQRSDERSEPRQPGIDPVWPL